MRILLSKQTSSDNRLNHRFQLCDDERVDVMAHFEVGTHSKKPELAICPFTVYNANILFVPTVWIGFGLPLCQCLKKYSDWMSSKLNMNMQWTEDNQTEDRKTEPNRKM